MQNVNRFPSSKLKLDEFFLNWLSSSDSQKLVRRVFSAAAWFRTPICWFAL